MAQLQVTQRQRIRHAVTAGTDITRQYARVANCLFDHIDAQVNRTGLVCQFAGNCGFASAG